MSSAGPTLAPSELKARAVQFLSALDHGNFAEMEHLLAEDVSHETVTMLPSAGVRRGKDTLMTWLQQGRQAVFPNGLNYKIGLTICEGAHVALQATCDVTLANGNRYTQRYTIWFRFEKDRIAQLREYNDSAHLLEVMTPGNRPGDIKSTTQR